MAFAIFIISLLAIGYAESAWSYYPQSQNNGYGNGGYVSSTQRPYSRNPVIVDLPYPNPNGYDINIGNGRNRQNNVVISQGGPSNPGYVYAETGQRNPQQPQARTSSVNNKCLTRNGHIIRYGVQPCTELNKNFNQGSNSQPLQPRYNSEDEEGISIVTRPDGTRTFNVGNGSSNKNTVVIGQDEYSNTGLGTRFGSDSGTTYYSGPANPRGNPSPRVDPYSQSYPDTRNHDQTTSRILIGRGKDNKNFVISDS